MVPLLPDCWIETPPPPGVPDLIPGLLKRSGPLLISGEHDVGKTLVALETAHSVVSGEPLWGSLPIVTQCQRVTYVLGEHSREVLHEQWKLAGFQTPPETIRVLGPEQRRILVGPQGADMLSAEFYKDKCRDSQLVVFDPISAFIAGQDAENDNTIMRTLFNVMEDIGKSSGAALLLLHHMGKPMFHEKSGKWVRGGRYESRGASAIEDAATYLFYMQAYPDRDNRFVLRRKKFKGEAPEAYYLVRDKMAHKRATPHWATWNAGDGLAIARRSPGDAPAT